MLECIARTSPTGSSTAPWERTIIHRGTIYIVAESLFFARNDRLWFHLNVLTFSPDSGMLRRSRCVIIFFKQYIITTMFDDVLQCFCFRCFSGVPAWRLMGFSPILCCWPNVTTIGNPFKCHEEVLYLQPMIPPKRFDIFPPWLGNAQKV